MSKPVGKTAAKKSKKKVITKGWRKNRMEMKWWEVLEQCKPLFVNGTLNRTFLHGPPGTGKSSWPVLYMKGTERVAITKGTTSDHLLGIFTLQDGETKWVDGPAARAMRNGTTLVLDEIVEYSEDVEAVLHAICDDLSICQVQLTNGEILRPAAGFNVFATTNGRPDQLGEALRDRFEVCLFCKEPHPTALKKLPEEIQGLVLNQYSSIPAIEIKMDRYSLRQTMAFDKLSKHLKDEDLAAWILFGKKGKEFISAVASRRSMR